MYTGFVEEQRKAMIEERKREKEERRRREEARMVRREAEENFWRDQVMVLTEKLEEARRGEEIRRKAREEVCVFRFFFFALCFWSFFLVVFWTVSFLVLTFFFAGAEEGCERGEHEDEGRDSEVEGEVGG